MKTITFIQISICLLIPLGAVPAYAQQGTHVAEPPSAASTTAAQEFFIVKLSPSGELLWSAYARSNKGSHGIGLETDAEGNVAVSGFFKGQLSLGNESFQSSAEKGKFFTAVYSPAGEKKHIDLLAVSPLKQFGKTAVTDVKGNRYVVGSFTKDATFDQQLKLKSKGAADIFIAKYDAKKRLQWLKRIGGESDDQGYALTLDKDGQLYVTGSFSGTFSLDHFQPSASERTEGTISTADDVVLVPNPAKDVVKVVIKGDTPESVVSYSVYSQGGDQVTTSVLPKEKTIDLGNYTNGVYMVKIKTAKGLFYVRKLVVNK